MTEARALVKAFRAEVVQAIPGAAYEDTFDDQLELFQVHVPSGGDARLDELGTKHGIWDTHNVDTQISAEGTTWVFYRGPDAPVVNAGRFDTRVSYMPGLLPNPYGPMYGYSVLDRADGTVGWGLSPSRAGAHHDAERWAHARLHTTRLPNPYEPPLPTADMTEGQRNQAKAARKAYFAESKHRGESVEEEKKIRELVRRGALFAVSHSGGKDSQAMLARVREVVPDEQIVLVHAPLRGVEWVGIVDQIRRYQPRGVDLLFADAVDSQGEQKWLLENVLKRGMWPDATQRWCTSDYKTGPIVKAVKAYADANRYSIIVEALGLRAEESERRTNRPILRKRTREDGVQPLDQSLPKREWWEWTPIKWMDTDEVFETIADAGQEPFWTYAEGMSRASCALCILASKDDLILAATMAPDLYAMYVAVERTIGHTLKSKSRTVSPDLYLLLYWSQKSPSRISQLDADEAAVLAFLRRSKAKRVGPDHAKVDPNIWHMFRSGDEIDENGKLTETGENLFLDDRARRKAAKKGIELGWLAEKEGDPERVVLTEKGRHVLWAVDDVAKRITKKRKADEGDDLPPGWKHRPDVESTKIPEPYPLESFTGLAPDEKLVNRYMKQIKETGRLRSIGEAGEKYAKRAGYKFMPVVSMEEATTTRPRRARLGVLGSDHLREAQVELVLL